MAYRDGRAPIWIFGFRARGELRGRLCVIAAVALASGGLLAAASPGSALAAFSGRGTGRGYCAHALRGGFVLGSGLNGVWACGPLPISHGDYGPPIPFFWQTHGYVLGGGFQCTEYATRYLYAATGGDFVNQDNLAGEGFAKTAADQFHLALTSSRSGELPKVGDIISEAQSLRGRANNVGDVAVVSAVNPGAGAITIYGENDTSSGYNTITMYSRTHWVINPGSSFQYTYFEWIDPTQHGGSLSPPHAHPIVPPHQPTHKVALPGTATAHVWNLASDFLAHPDKNPAPDHYGDAGVWRFEQSASLALDGNYSLLPNHIANFESSAGTQGWSGDEASGCSTGSVGLPIVVINTAARPATGCGTWTVPPYTVDVHPGSSHAAIVSWNSPIAGSVTINGSATSIDPHGGGGITYGVTDGLRSLIAGSIPDGGNAQFPPTTVDVVSGSILDFIVSPPASGLGYNSTALKVTITPGPGAMPVPTSYRVIGLTRSQTLPVRHRPRTGTRVIGHLHNGQRVTVLCQTTGSVVARRSRIWDEIGAGYVSDYYVDTPAVGKFSPGIPRCPG